MVSFSDFIQQRNLSPTWRAYWVFLAMLACSLLHVLFGASRKPLLQKFDLRKGTL
jgi:hypothetical protein